MKPKNILSEVVSGVFDEHSTSLNCSTHETKILSVAISATEKTEGSEFSVVYFCEKFLQHIKSCECDIKVKTNGHFVLYADGYWSDISRTVLEKAMYMYAKTIGTDQSNTTASYIKKCADQLALIADIISTVSDNNALLLNMSNNCIVIDDNGNISVKPHNKDYGFFYKLSYDYDPNTQCPLFERFLDRVLPDNDLQDALLSFLAYCLMPKINIEKSMILLGEGSNGKSVFFNIVKALFGDENVTSYELSSLTDTIGYTRAMIENKLINYSTEISSKKINPEYLKKLVSGEPIDARLPYTYPYMIRRYARMIFNANDLPYTDDTTHGYFRRFLIIPFSVKISDKEKDPLLAQKIIQSELPGIFNLVLSKIAKLLQNKKIETPKKSRIKLKEYETDNNSVFYFIKEYPVRKSCRSTSNPIPGMEIYEKYKAFCINVGLKAVSYRKFVKHFSSKIKSAKINRVIHFYCSITQ